MFPLPPYTLLSFPYATHNNVFFPFFDNMALTSLVRLSISTIIHQHGSFVEKCELRALPESLLRELLLSSILRSRILFLRSLITIWPSQRLILRDVVEFDEPKAVLLAYCLQRVASNLKLVDIRGCKISEWATKPNNGRNIHTAY